MRQIKFAKTCRYSALGRNGAMHTTGLVIHDTAFDAEILLEPLNTKGRTGRCHIGIPKDVVPEVVEELLRLSGKDQPAPAAAAPRSISARLILAMLEVIDNEIDQRQNSGNVEDSADLERLSDEVHTAMGSAQAADSVSVDDDLLSEDELAEFMSYRLENGEWDLEDIPVRLARFGLMDPVAFCDEMRERMELRDQDASHEDIGHTGAGSLSQPREPYILPINLGNVP